MRLFRNYLKADLYKFSKSKIIISHFIIPIVGVILMSLYFRFSQSNKIEEVSAYIEVISMAFPLIISIVITMIYEQEDEEGFKYFLSTPSKRCIPHISKLLLLFVFGLIATLISILGFGLLSNLMDTEKINITFYLILAIVIFVSNVPLYMMQYLIAFCFGKGANMGAGIIGSLISALMATGLGNGIWFVLPWGYSVGLSGFFLQYFMNEKSNVLLQNDVKLAVASLIVFVAISIIILTIFSKNWEGVREYS